MQQITAEQDKSKSRAVTGVLYIVATPIGNLGDMTFRAVDTLKHATAIACEDTRTSRVLLDHYQITTPMITYHEHNAAKMRPELIARLMAGESIALISDAGTPLISDPGFKLVCDVRAAGLPVIPIPGANAAITALCAAGLPTDHFTFAGFLPPKSTARKQALQKIAAHHGTFVFYESPKRLLAMLGDVQNCWGNANIVVARELTKRYEEFVCGAIGDVIAQLSSREQIKGEIVVVVSPPAKQKLWDDTTIDAALREQLARHSTKQAVQELAMQTGLSRSMLYQRALQLKS